MTVRFSLLLWGVRSVQFVRSVPFVKGWYYYVRSVCQFVRFSLSRNGIIMFVRFSLSREFVGGIIMSVRFSLLGMVLLCPFGSVCLGMVLLCPFGSVCLEMVLLWGWYYYVRSFQFV